MYQQLIIKSGRERSIYNRHPWLFSGAVKQLPNAGEGDIVQVCSNHGDVLAYGFYSSANQIVCRMFEFNTDATFVADATYWYQKVQHAFELREKYVLNTETNAYRLLHAEGDFLPGIICDVYNSIASVQILVKGTQLIQDILLNAIMDIAGVKHIYLKTKKSSKVIEQVSASTDWINPPEEVKTIVKEHGLQFFVDVEKGQKTGFFIDQRENRRLLQQFCSGKKILNTFSYTGGFSAYALAGGASLVHSVDISKEACQLCDENIRLNFPSLNKHQSFAADCFDYIKTADTDYDIIILDPPAFAKNARAVDNAARGYKELNMAAIKKIKAGGLIFTFSCSQNIDRDLFRKIVFSAAADARRNVRILYQFTQPADHPVNIFHPEGEYLKGLLLEVE